MTYDPINADDDDEIDSSTISDHATSHENTGEDELDVTGLSGDLADEQDPKAHSSEHESGGTDEVSVAGLSGDLADPQDPKTHASEHADSGTDSVDHDTLTNYVADEHVDHTGVDVTAGAGLTGGGSIDSTVTVDGHSTSVVTSDYTITDENEVVVADGSSSAVTVTLPSPSPDLDIVISAFNTSTNATTVTAPGTENLNGSDQDLTISSDYSAGTLRIVSDGTEFYAI